MKNPTYFSGKAIEKLINKSICIKEGDNIRNIRNYDELFTEKTVFVCKIINTNDMSNDIILNKEMVRYFFVNCSFVI